MQGVLFYSACSGHSYRLTTQIKAIYTYSACDESLICIAALYIACKLTTAAAAAALRRRHRAARLICRRNDLQTTTRHQFNLILLSAYCLELSYQLREPGQRVCVL